MARFGIPSIIIETCCFSGVSSNPSFLSTNQWEFGTSMVAWYSARLVANPVVRLFPVCLKDIVQDLKAHLPRNQENLGCCPTAAACFWIDLYMTWVGILQKPAWKKIWRIHHELDRLKVNSHWIGGANNSPITNARIEAICRDCSLLFVEKWIWFLLQSSGMVAAKSAVSGANKSTSLFSQTTIQLPEDTSLQIGNPSAHVVNNNEKHSSFKIPSGLVISQFSMENHHCS